MTDGMPERQKRPKRRIPEATVARLPLYLRSLLEVADDGTATISSERLAELSGVNAAQVRKDLSYLGSYGTRGVGYDVEYLLFQMSRELGLTSDWPVVIVGLGNLGHALANYGGFHERGFPIAALVDSSEHVVGTQINGVTVRHVDDLPQIAAEIGIAIGIIATPAHAAQEVADRLIEAGVTSVLNFAPTILSVPDEVSLRKVDLAVELQILSFYQRRKGGDGQRRAPGLDAGGATPAGPDGAPAPAPVRAGNAAKSAGKAGGAAGAARSEPEPEPAETTSAPTSG
jgi:redox-sensing transcriptional repressor